MTYEEFADSRLSALLRYAVMLTGDPASAQDLVQETMVRAQLHWRKVAASDSPDGYVRRILTNQFIDLRRGSWWRRVLLRAEPDESATVATDHADESAERDRMWSLLARLPRRQRAAPVLRYYEDLPDQEIADILGCGHRHGPLAHNRSFLRALSLKVMSGGIGLGELQGLLAAAEDGIEVDGDTLALLRLAASLDRPELIGIGARAAAGGAEGSRTEAIYPRVGAGLFAAIRADRVGEWAEANPDYVDA